MNFFFKNTHKYVKTLSEARKISSKFTNHSQKILFIEKRYVLLLILCKITKLKDLLTGLEGVISYYLHKSPKDKQTKLGSMQNLLTQFSMI